MGFQGGYSGLHIEGNTAKQDMAEYFKSFGRLPALWSRRAFAVPSKEDFENERSVGDSMSKVLDGWDLMALGVGIILGAGIFVITGLVAHDYAGPATWVSYMIAGVSALLSALCYAEFAVQYPVAGGAFTYIRYTFGEFMAWITVANLVLEYVLANAAVARSFSGYFANLVGQSSDFFMVAGYIDFMAFGLILFETVLLAYGTKESAWFNNFMTVLHIGVVAFIIIVGFTQSDTSNMTPFAPYGLTGIFNGAALVFFSYIGFDAVATAAEECKNPARDLPMGIVGSMLIVTVFYVLAAVALTLMQPWDSIDVQAAYATAFKVVGMGWATYVVALGALIGIVTGVLVGMLAVARLVAVMARDGMLPPILSYIHPKFKTPIVSTLLLGVFTALIALFTAFDTLANMVSLCTLFVFWLVAQAMMFKRYYVHGETNTVVLPKLLILLAAQLMCCIGFTVIYRTTNGLVMVIGISVFGSLWLASVVLLALLLPVAHVNADYRVPLQPYLPSFSAFLNTFLLGSIGGWDWLRFLIWLTIAVMIYLFYVLYSTDLYQSRKGSAELPSIREEDQEMAKLSSVPLSDDKE